MFQQVLEGQPPVCRENQAYTSFEATMSLHLPPGFLVETIGILHCSACSYSRRSYKKEQGGCSPGKDCSISGQKRGKASSARVSERTSENLREVHTRRLSVVLPLIVLPLKLSLLIPPFQEHYRWEKVILELVSVE